MLQRLQLDNFQSHERLRIDLDPKITTIVGPSDTGKSAVIRSICWIVFNRPLGESRIRDGTAEASAKAMVGGVTIIRRRGGATNLYRIAGQDFKTFGTDSPKEVGELFCLGDVNIQQQHDPPFWFCLSPGEVAKSLNRVVDLDIIDSVLDQLASVVRKTKTAQEVAQDRLQEARKAKERKNRLKSLRATATKHNNIVVREQINLAPLTAFRDRATTTSSRISVLRSLLKQIDLRQRELARRFSGKFQRS